MDTILVTTDFSAKSRAGLKYAIRLASQSSFELVFFHVCHVRQRSSQGGLSAADYEKEEVKKMKEKLQVFVDHLYNDMHTAQQHTKCVVKNSPMPQSCIMDYAVRSKCSFICISTGGAGKIERLLGSNTANLIHHSPVPVIAVPFNYKIKPVKTILYVSDLANLEKEIKKVVAFARPLQAKLEMLHFTTLFENIKDDSEIVQAVQKASGYAVKLHIKNRNLLATLVADIAVAIKKSNPSMLVMFTEQNQNLFQRFFNSGKSAAYSYQAKIPLLVFNKS